MKQVFKYSIPMLAIIMVAIGASFLLTLNNDTQNPTISKERLAYAKQLEAHPFHPLNQPSLEEVIYKLKS